MNGTTPLLKPFRFCPQCGSERFVDNNVQSKRCLDCGLIYYINPKPPSWLSLPTNRAIFSCAGAPKIRHGELSTSRAALPISTRWPKKPSPAKYGKKPRSLLPRPDTSSPCPTSMPTAVSSYPRWISFSSVV